MQLEGQEREEKGEEGEGQVAVDRGEWRSQGETLMDDYADGMRLMNT